MDTRLMPMVSMSSLRLDPLRRPSASGARNVLHLLPSTPRRPRIEPALYYTAVDELAVAPGYPVQLPRRHALVLVWPRSRVSRRGGRGVVAFVRAAGVIVGGSALSVSTASIRHPYHPSAAPDIYGTLLLLFRT
ncbi:hypothetical protein C8R45DRAFT_1114942 [Mycena sanguinolenta]|nr:hypothetical protein C8R45DRAFT_1114942 [Mycena sanguinolenta]